MAISTDPSISTLQSTKSNTWLLVLTFDSAVAGAVVFDEGLRPAQALKSAINTATQLEPAKWSYGNQSSDWWSSWQTSLG